MNEDDCLRFDPDVYAIAQARVKNAPIELTEPELDQLAIVSKTLEALARERKRLAQLALVQPATDPTLTTKRAALESSASVEAETTDEWLQKNGRKSVTGHVLMEAVDVLMDVLKAHKTRADKLEQANKELSSRVLELEAKDAARMVPHADR